MPHPETNPYLQPRNVPFSERLKNDIPYFPDSYHPSAIKILDFTFDQFDYVLQLEHAEINNVQTIRVISEKINLTLEWVNGVSSPPTQTKYRRCLTCGKKAVRKNICKFHSDLLKSRGFYTTCEVFDCINITDDSDTSTCSEHKIEDLPLESRKYFMQEPVHHYVTEGR